MLALASDSLTQQQAMECECRLCGFATDKPDPRDLGRAYGNTTRFAATLFRLWKCPRCGTIRTLDPVDYADIYADYPLKKRRLDVFARATLRNLLRRLRRAGLKPTDSILDVGCGNGLFVRFLQERGYVHVRGYDPYVQEFAEPISEDDQFTCVVANDVIEHCDDPVSFIESCLARVKPGGLLYVGTSDSEDVCMDKLQRHLMRLHLPFHRTIFTQQRLHALMARDDLEIVCSWRRSYMDTLVPFANYRLLDELNYALGHNLDLALDPSAVARALLRRPRLWFYALFGYLCPSAYEPAVAVRKSRGSKTSLAR